MLGRCGGEEDGLGLGIWISVPWIDGLWMEAGLLFCAMYTISISCQSFIFLEHYWSKSKEMAK